MLAGMKSFFSGGARKKEEVKKEVPAAKSSS